MYYIQYSFNKTREKKILTNHKEKTHIQYCTVFIKEIHI